MVSPNDFGHFHFVRDRGCRGAQSQFVKGTATVPLKGKCRKDVPRDNKIFQAAFTQAKKKPYGLIQAVSVERSKIYKMVADEVEMNIDQYLANPSVVGQRCDSQTKTFTIVLRGQLNTSDLNYLISQNMAPSGRRLLWWPFSRARN